ncbi:ClpA/ClpB-like protein [Actinomycetospora succinea]|uniref:ClpA/ClpB-like protein n=1 Tax=Actinomycetospora succinea TaxID=663603 RepID=A0A4V3D9U3_9PSEU|nr:Clp protease N-terminal domain-containing protein [Actinomycetospora succinea]TDQ58732.1 ClpA/ClpB-like protein [Actinomycetospora succinea]
MLSGAGDAAPLEGGSPDDPELVAWARGLGALQEAERLGSVRVGTEHLLLASLLDPVARRLAHDAGIDFSVVQRDIGPPVRAGIGARPGLLPTTDQLRLSDGADHALRALRDDAAGDTRFDGWVRPDRSTDPRARSVLRRRLLAALVEGEGTGAARSVLARLDVPPHTTRLVARLAEPDPAGPH